MSKEDRVSLPAKGYVSRGLGSHPPLAYREQRKGAFADQATSPEDALVRTNRDPFPFEGWDGCQK